jgi:hypothetical protein
VYTDIVGFWGEAKAKGWGMAKWADYGISKVRYNEKHQHIVKVKARVDNGDSIGPPTEMTRETVVKKLKDGETFVTIPLKDGKFTKGEDVRIVKVNGVEYIRTDQNQKESDNLGELPEF